MRWITRWTVLTFSLSLAACADRATAPSALDAMEGSAALAAPKFWEANATANWHDLATSLAARRATNAVRMYTYLSLAQLRAGEAAEAVKPHSPTGSAIGAASARVLTSFFPLDATEIATALLSQRNATPWAGAKHEDFAHGAALGDAVAVQVLAYAAGDRLNLADPGTPPTTDGSWAWSPGQPIARGNFGARAFFLATPDQFRPVAPPKYGSPEFVAALAEVRLISDTRTATQVAIATFWNANQSPGSNAAITNLAVELLRRYRRGDVESARIMFLMNAAAWDAVIGCFDAKYHFWYIRPSQADAGIRLVVGLPPHPSYPSAHSCVSGSTTGVLTAFFPEEATRLASFAQEASVSRVYAGLHYRFDGEAGLALGRSVAALALSTDLHAIAGP